MTADCDATALDFVLVRAADAEAFERWALQGRSARWCSHPVRLAGSTTTLDTASGEVLGRYSTAGEPDRALVKACGQRRATACPQCAEVYRADAWHLIASGLRGGKGVPDCVAGHPMVFVTLTAPSFGAVHSRRELRGQARECRSSGRGRCNHGRPRRCHLVHRPEDERLGEPLCPECFDYQGAVLWNALATELWRRSTIGVARVLASLIGISQAALTRSMRLSFAKVVEYQRRGVVHVHAVARIDGPDGPDSSPHVSVPVGMLEMATRQAAASARVPYPVGAGVSGSATWGAEINIRPIATTGTRPEAVAAYIAKYATKSTDGLGQLDHKLRPGDFATLNLPAHLARMVTTAWELGARPELAHLRLRDWAHTLGFRGHWLTKSRRYSTTFAALRTARAAWTGQQQGTVARPPGATVVKDWRTWVEVGPTPATPGSPKPPPPPGPTSAATPETPDEPKPQSPNEGELPMDKLLLTPEEAADRLSVGRSKVYELIGSGRLRSVRIGASRRIPAAALVEFVRDLDPNGGAPDPGS